ncbi:unnamed protein product, partial [Medioppia subpectinata]
MTKMMPSFSAAGLRKNPSLIPLFFFAGL